MRKIFTLSFLIGLAATVNAQDFAWSRVAGLWEYDYGYGIGTDAAGNVFVAGKYEQNAVFDNITVTCAGNHDVFLAKYDPSGTLQWVKTGGGPMGDYAHAMTVDASGNVYLAGEIDGTSMFGSTTVTANPSPDDAFVAKYDNNGNLIWAKSYGGYSRDDARGISVDASGNIYIIGVFQNTATFGTFTLTASGQDIDDAYVMKLDPSGNVLWAKAISGPGDDTGKGIAVDASGNAYAVGGFINTTSFGGSQSLTAPNGYRDLYISKWDPNGNLLWVQQAGGQYDDVAWAVTLDGSGNPYITGEFNASATFGTYTVNTVGNADIFVAKYDPSGNVTWVNRFGGSLIDRGRGIATDNTNVYFTGQYGGTITNGSYTATSADSSDIFVASFSVSGGPGWIVTPRGTPDAYESLGYEGGNAVCAAGGNVFVTGCYLDGDTLNWLYEPSWSRTDMFVAKIDPQLTPGTIGINDPVVSSGIGIYPNPTENSTSIEFNASVKDAYSITLINSLGQTVYSEALNNFSGRYLKKIDLSSYGKGMYILNIKGSSSSRMQKIAVY